MIEKLRDAFRSNLLHLFPVRRPHSAPGAAQSPHRLLFVFQGRTGQWPGMGQQLYREEPVFREAIQRCSRVVEERLGWSPHEEFTKEKKTYRLAKYVPYIQIALSAIQLALCELWLDRGIEPDGVLGYSGGESAAAYAAGGLSFEDALMTHCASYSLIQQCSIPGKLIRVALDLVQAQHLCQRSPVPLYVMAETGLCQVLLACADENLAAVTSFLEDSGVRNRFLQLDFVYHTPLMEPWKTRWLHDLRNLKPRPLTRACYSSMTGGRLEQSTVLDPLHCWRVLSQPVLLASALRAALADGYDSFLIISPHPVWTESIAEIAAMLGKKIEIFFSIRSDVRESKTWKNSYRDLRARGFGAARGIVSVQDTPPAADRGNATI